MYNVEIRDMSLEHIDEIMIVENLSFSIPWSREAFIEEVTGNKFARYLISTVDSRVVGYAGMWKVCDEGHITNIAVHPEYRRTGIGRLLMDKLVSIAAQDGVKSMTLEVRRSNYQAQMLYKEFGFEECGVRKGYYADNGEDAIVMWKYNMDK